METFFLEKETLSSSYFLLFPTFKISDFLPKNVIIRAEKTFSRIITISYAFYSKFAKFIDFEKTSSFFRETHPFFQKKPQILNVLRNLTISVEFYGKFATIW